MKVVIIGAGAMGSLFGGLLAEMNLTVWLFDVWAEHVNHINTDGLTIERNDTRRAISIRATTDPDDIGKADVVLIFVKSMQTGAAARSAAKMLTDTGVCITLQNGLGNAARIADIVGGGRVVAGTTAHGATLVGPGIIRHAGTGPTIVGMWEGRQNDRLAEIAHLFSRAGIATQVVENVQEVVWHKLLINVGINAITALTGINNGELLDLDVTRSLCRTAVEEAVAVAKAMDVKVDANVVERVFQVANATAMNRSSMGQDIDNRRQTEIDAINGAVVREAHKLGLPVPVNQTLTALIQTRQSHYR
jgi:2-dehydropantoate 2-reductase